MDIREIDSKPSSRALNVAAFVVILAGVMAASSIVSSLLLALFISIICARPIGWLQKKKVPQGIAIFLVFIGIIAVFFFFGELISQSLSSFSRNAPLYEQNLTQMELEVMSYFKDNGIPISFNKVSDMLEPSKLMGLTAGVLGQLGGFMGNTLTIIFLVLFLLMEVDSLDIKIKAISNGKTNSISYLDVIGKNILHYLSIKTFTSFITGLLIWIFLKIMGLDYAILWALIAFLLNYIPTFGSIIAAVPAVLFSFIQFGLGGGFGVALVFIAVNVIVGNVVEPKMMGKGLGLSTFVVFFSLLFWGYILGTVGMFLSIPITMAIKIMLEQNPKTNAIAIFLGTQEEAQIIVDENNN